MQTLYTILFFVGLIYAVVSFLLGSLFDFLDLEIDVEVDISPDMETPLFTVSPLKPVVVVSFLLIFGGLGMIGSMRDWSGLVTFLVAFAVAFIVAFIIIYRLIIVNLYKVQKKNLATKQEEAIGTEAEVVSTILENGYGKITYKIRKNQFTGAAKSIDGSKIPQGATVVIEKADDFTFYVSEKVCETSNTSDVS